MIFIDLDGTLLDIWERFYKVFCELTGAEGITLEQYKKSKKCFLRDEKLAEIYGYRLPEDYFVKKAVMLEDKNFLESDKLYFPKELIKELEQKEVVILTKRRNFSNLEWELKKLEVSIPFVMVNQETKCQWIRKKYRNETCIVIGDSNMDLETGRLENVRNVMAGYGIGSKRQFDEMDIPYKYVETVNEMEKYLRSL